MDGYYDQRQTKQMQAKLREMDKNQVKWRVVNDMSQSNRIQCFQAKQTRVLKSETPECVFRKSHQVLKQSFNRRLGLQSQQSAKSQILLQQQNNKFMMQQSAY